MIFFLIIIGKTMQVIKVPAIINGIGNETCMSSRYMRVYINNPTY